MSTRRRSRWACSGLLLAFLAGAARGEDAATPGKGSPDVSPANGEEWTFTVIRLKHARAQHLADTLGRILPPGMVVVPDPPTNSLILAGPSSSAAHVIAPRAPE